MGFNYLWAGVLLRAACVVLFAMTTSLVRNRHVRLVFHFEHRLQLTKHHVYVVDKKDMLTTAFVLLARVIDTRCQSLLGIRNG